MSVTSTWFVLIGTEKYGPYSYRQMIEMQQSHQLLDFNYIWSAHLEAWTPLYQVEEFGKDRFRLLLQNENPLKDAFTLRRHSRKAVEIPLLAHNQIRFFDGQVISLSRAGALCLFNSPLVQIGDPIKMCLTPSQNPNENFSVAGLVVRKNFSHKRLNSKSGLHYAVVFSEPPENIESWIA